MITEEKLKFYKSLVFPSLLLIGLWGVKLVEILLHSDYYYLGIFPKSAEGLTGIVTAFFIHGDFNHLISNSLPLFISTLALFFFYKNAAWRVFLFIYFITGILVWLFGREVWHIGASGVVYGLISFLFFSGIFRRDNRSIALALIVTFLYGGMVWGVLPVRGISWESHLFGGLTGTAMAFFFRKSDPVKKYDWEDEEDEIPETDSDDQVE